jgi:hypothetical protein
MNDLRTEQTGKESIEIPASTAWPIILAFGITLCFASLVTNVGVGLAGLALVCCGVTGWAKEVLPDEHHEIVDVRARKFVPVSLRTRVAHIQLNEIIVRSFPSRAIRSCRVYAAALPAESS